MLVSELEHVFSRDFFTFADADIPEYFRRSAVLVLVWQSSLGLKTVLTKRSDKLSNHPGEMCFPGGGLDEGESSGAGALREFEEEMGVPRESITIVGRLDDAWSGSGYHMVPIVGYIDFEPIFVPNDEVADVFEIPLQIQHEVGSVVASKNGVEYVDPVLSYNGQKFYGLTTDLLLEAIEVLQGIKGRRGETRVEYLRQYIASK
ncbi:MAG: CoA pyrophosphatase [Halioglobus sp.]